VRRARKSAVPPEGGCCYPRLRETTLTHAPATYYRERGIHVATVEEPARHSPFIEEIVVHGEGAFDLETEVDLFAAQLSAQLRAARQQTMGRYPRPARRRQTESCSIATSGSRLLGECLPVREGGLRPSRPGQAGDLACPPSRSRGAVHHLLHGHSTEAVEAKQWRSERWMMPAGDRKSGCSSFAAARPSS
jgi:hypothetical protein